MKFSLINTRSIVIAGYCLLVALAMTGIVTIYLEVVKSQRQSRDDSDLKKELINLSNTLTTMYQAEGTASLLALADNNEHLKLEYDSLTNRVFDQIDSLRIISTDSLINCSIDSLSSLLLQKRKYAMEMFQLMAQIDKDIVKEFMKRTVINRTDVDKLKSLLADVTNEKSDTVQVIAEKKGFFQRVRDVVRSNTDTLTHISKSSSVETKELMIPLLSDTIINFIQQIDKHVKQKNTKIVRLLVNRQQELYVIKELTGEQINKIMEAMKEREYQASMELLNEKNESLKRSSSLVAIVGLLALVVAVFFMSWTLHSLNKAQQLQKSIQEAQKHAEKLLISREQLIYTITHDIKAPLSSIIGFLDLLISEGQLSQKQHYYLSNMYSSASQIQDLVRNLLDFHSIEREQPQLTSIVFSPDSLIHNIYESFLPLAQKKKLVFDLNITFPTNETFLSDPYYIRQIVNNLLSNAIKFTPENGRVVLISSPEKQNRWKISVQDTGPGIDPEDQVKVFDEFVRLDKQKNDVEGTGLGLAISKNLATLLGGTIEIESEKGSGSTFILTVPLTSVAKKTVSLPNQTSGRILFVDDDQVQLNLLSELMKREGLPCICCLSAYEALDYLRETSVDLIFTDIHIPDMEGFELVKQIRESNFPQAATIPVIAFSADSQKSESELKETGFNGFLLKPFTLNQLLDVIEQHTSFKRKTEESSSKDEDGFGWQKIMDFATDDPEVAIKIIDSFIEETNKDREHLKIAFQKKDNEAIKQISHKMLSLMRMISAHEIASILTDSEKVAISKEKRATLFRLLEGTIEDAKIKRQAIDEMTVIEK